MCIRDRNMAGGWPLGPSSFGNPGTFQTTPARNVVADPACGTVLPAQGVAGGAASIQANFNGYSKCGYNYVPFGNYIDPQERHKFFASMTMEINDDVELYAEAFDKAGKIDKLEGFASHFGADFYDLPRNTDTITLERSPWTVPDSYDFSNTKVIPFFAGEQLNWKTLY